MKREFSKRQKSYKNELELLQIKSCINKIKTQLKASLIDWIKLKTGYQGTEDGVDLLEKSDEDKGK
jgi:hypothetical protein